MREVYEFKWHQGVLRHKKTMSCFCMCLYVFVIRYLYQCTQNHHKHAGELTVLGLPEATGQIRRDAEEECGH